MTRLANDFFARLELVEMGMFELCYRLGIITQEHLDHMP
jgi:hypothetical protein